MNIEKHIEQYIKMLKASGMSIRIASSRVEGIACKKAIQVFEKGKVRH